MEKEKEEICIPGPLVRNRWVPLLSKPIAQYYRRACCSVAKSCLTPCDPHGLQHARLLCPSVFPGICSNSCPLSRWYYLTISSSATFFLQSFPASGSFPVSWLFAPSSQTIGASAYRLLRRQVKSSGIPISSRMFHSCDPHGQKHVSFQWRFRCSAFFMIQLSHPYMTNEENIALTMWTFVGKEMSLLLSIYVWFVSCPIIRHAHLYIFSFSLVIKMLLWILLYTYLW